MPTYTLVNPIIDSNINLNFKGDNHLEASKKAYKTISKFFSNKVKNYNFTLVRNKKNTNDFTKINDKYFYHFNVKEKNDDDIKFTIKEISKKPLFLGEFKERIDKQFKKNTDLTGGHTKNKFYNFDFDNDDIEDDFYVKRNKILPTINTWWYSPLLYNIDSMYLPTFIAPLSFPYLIDFTPYYYIVNNNPSLLLTEPVVNITHK